MKCGYPGSLYHDEQSFGYDVFGAGILGGLINNVIFFLMISLPDARIAAVVLAGKEDTKLRKAIEEYRDSKFMIYSNCIMKMIL